MLRDVIVDYVLRNRERILSPITGEVDEAELPSIEWRFYPLRRGGVFTGVDGSVNYAEYKGCLFAVVNAEAVTVSQGVRRAAAGGFADFILPYWLPRERAKTYMSILEARVAAEALSNNRDTIMLMDGSLLNAFPKALRRYYRSRVAAEYEGRVYEGLEGGCRGVCDSVVREYVRGIAGEEKSGEDVKSVVASLELAELTASLSYLVEKYSGRILWVAKNSTDNSLFRRGVSDIVVLDHLTRGRGYLPVGKARVDPPRGLEASKKLMDTDIHVYYVRLAEGGPVLRVEAPGVDEKTAVKLFGLLADVSPAGYPYVLRVAHRDVIVRRRDLESIAGLLGLEVLTAARWFL